MGLESVFAFLSVAILFIITPGIDTVYVLNKSLVKGKSAGIQSGLGINTAMFLQIIVLGLLISLAVSKISVILFVLKVVGAIYLSVLGGRLILNRDTEEKPEAKEGNAFWGGMLTNLLNPKAAMFVIAFFPQFINDETLNNPMPYISLGLLYAAVGVLWLSLLAILAWKFNSFFKAGSKAKAIMNYITGLLFIFFAFVILVS